MPVTGESYNKVTENNYRLLLITKIFAWLQDFQNIWNPRIEPIENISQSILFSVD
jgi:hypothetical protein